MSGKEIKALRNKLNLTQKEFAAKLNVARFSIINWEKDAYKPDPRNQVALDKLAEDLKSVKQGKEAKT